MFRKFFEESCYYRNIQIFFLSSIYRYKKQKKNLLKTSIILIQALTRLPKQLPLKASHCVKSVQIRRFFWSVSSRIRIEYGDLNTDIYEVNLRIQSEYRKIQTRKNSVFGLPYPANNYFFKVNNRSTRKRCEICPKLTIKTPLRRQ